MIKVNNISKRFGKGKSSITALKDISLNIEYGEFIVIMGKSGSGKSTLLNIISTIDTPSSGNIFFKNIDIVNLSRNQANKFRRENLGFVFQDFKLINNMTIEENIVVPLIINKEESTIIKKEVNYIMDYLDINNIKNKYPYECSGGEKQRAVCGRAIISRPKIILADEPTGALDSKLAKELMEMLKKINKEFNSTILMVTHDPYIANYGNRVLFIKDGSIIKKLNNSDNNMDIKNILNLQNLL